MTVVERAALFDLIGGAETIDRLVEAFYQRMDTLPEAKGIRAMHRPDLASTKAVLKLYLGEWTGGPKLYSAEKGHPQLRRRHLGVPIGESERDAWLLCMRGALDEAVADAQAREVLFQAMAGLADWMRNQPGNAHDAGSAAHP